MKVSGHTILERMLDVLRMKPPKGYRDLPGQKSPRKKKAVGPGVGTNRMRRVREGKNW